MTINIKRHPKIFYQHANSKLEAGGQFVSNKMICLKVKDRLKCMRMILTNIVKAEIVDKRLVREVWVKIIGKVVMIFPRH